MRTHTFKEGATCGSADQDARRRDLAIADYTRFRAQGFLLMPGLVRPDEVEQLRASGRELTRGAAPSGGAAAPMWFPMLHRTHPLHERMALHPYVLDVVQALIGPDVMAMQTMLFLKPPGERGNGWHQDSWYLQTFPDSLCGAWIALDACDEENGALVVAVGSHVEPIYSHERQPHPDRELLGMGPMEHLHDPDDAVNELAGVAARYPQVVVHAEPGDVVFLHGHVLHTSLPNISRERQRRAFVSHYANARSFTSWGAQYPHGHPQHSPPDPLWGGMTNGSFILARGTSHLPTGLPFAM